MFMLRKFVLIKISFIRCLGLSVPGLDTEVEQVGLSLPWILLKGLNLSVTLVYT